MADCEAWPRHHEKRHTNATRRLATTLRAAVGSTARRVVKISQSGCGHVRIKTIIVPPAALSSIQENTSAHLNSYPSLSRPSVTGTPVYLSLGHL